VRVPLFDSSTPLAQLRSQLHARAIEVLDSQSFVLGEQLDAFEREFAAYLGARHVIGVGNGTDGLTLALRALGIGPGDDVVVPSFSFWASAEAVPPTGARPVFCDIDPDTYCVTPDTVKAALTARTKAVIAVDLFGWPAPVQEIEALGVPVLEDAAQAAGARLNGRHTGTLGAAGAFSFYPSKNLGGFGDGGAVVTDDDSIAKRVRMLRTHGSRDRSTYEVIGFNSRLDELQAGLLRVLLPELDGWVERRRDAASYYGELGIGDLVACPMTSRGVDPAWHLYVVRHGAADRLVDTLAEHGIVSRPYYRRPIHRQPAMKPFADGVTLPATDEASASNFAIPMSPVLSREQAGAVVSALRATVERLGAAVG
jgi:dTDP-4-amino-4,6-dideoxygalactose transaminase